MTMTLVCPLGAEFAPISHGKRGYIAYLADHTKGEELNAVWLVDVEDEHAEPMLHNGGFYVPQTEIIQTGGMIPITHPDPGVTGFSCFGKFWEFDKKRVVEIPIEKIEEARSHGFVVYEGEPIESVEPAPPPVAQNAKGGAIREMIFAPGGDHPEGGEQPVLSDEPAEVPVVERKTGGARKS